ncbi:hypothetical protein NDU88_007633 [Pleurodeles waltl]|uniref:Uncharacterized protein n=1 Tax=Pleurodeles waltl TaxID=8319 RepID=A0AAV7PPJ9_PLEWA|nr:hypothetical protein NDU88_007633 [Pleurodeles waltl]
MAETQTCVLLLACRVPPPLNDPTEGQRPRRPYSSRRPGGRVEAVGETALQPTDLGCTHEATVGFYKKYFFFNCRTVVREKLELKDKTEVFEGI